METFAPSADQATNLLQNLSLDSQSKTHEAPEATEKSSAIQYESVDAGEVKSVQIPSYERATTSLLQDVMDPSMCYLPNGYASTAYYHGGYDAPINDWKDYNNYVNTDGMEMPPGVYGDNGSLMDHNGCGYTPYGAYPSAASPVPTLGHDSQFYGPQHYQYTVRPGGYNGYDSRRKGHGWPTIDNKYRPRGQGTGFFGYGTENVDGLNELNRGPRDGRFKNQNGFAPSITLAVKAQNLPSNGTKDSSVVPDRDQYNLLEFPLKYSDAKFFIIKSYSEDDIHKSIKYSVWASTPNGNNKLDSAFLEAQENSGGCPLFLFFSVNTSGQFVGLAEMVGPVDFNKDLDYWQQDKWNGCFPVKWHVVKDVPNYLLKHITLENNENKPVTNSRDTQEVKFDQGLEMLKIFKDHTSKTCIFDDFWFYEARQKTMQERKAKQQLFQKQVWFGKLSDAGANEIEKDGSNTRSRWQKPLNVSPVLCRELGQTIEDRKLSEENGVVAGY
ncbi:YTH domain-containing protein ECT4-like isoform X2 [Tasmannia lanceolata]|uniref:YTH domain-containing protein ECT4-like isoform X2 n=1 Tax=Tasmannia lanceolata TaxID=3420 RepID=UPI0040630B3F